MRSSTVCSARAVLRRRNKKNINLIFSHISLSFCIRLARLHGNEVSIFCIFGRFLSVVALACF